MKKKTILILSVVVVILIAAGAYVGFRMANRGKDIIGVTTLTNKNTVIMNSATGNEFVSGSGTITVKEGEHIHLTYKLKSGSFDIGFNPGTDGVLEAVTNLDMTELEDPTQNPSEYAIEQKGIEGNGEADFEAQSGEYTVYFTMNGAVGTATVSTAKD